MIVPRTSRELAERVEIDSQKHLNRFRQVTWWTALGIGVVAFGWVGIEFLRGEQRLYQAGPVSTAHKMFENDCAKCHAEWSLGKRFFTMDDSVKSVTDEKCLACHDGPAHFVKATGGKKASGSVSPGKADPHHGIACATCHREHIGKADLARVTNQHCVNCHGDLGDVDPSSTTFAKDIRQFDDTPKSGAHPPFAIERLLASASGKSNVPAAHAVHQLIQYLERPGESPRWQDAAQIRFNHALHLKPGLPDKDGRPLDLSKNCSACHELDAERRYMLPVNYKKHCAECHPLYFDAKYPSATVPHDSPELVRGFLTDFYAQRIAEKAGPDANPLARERPGRDSSDEQKQARKAELRKQVAAAEHAAQRHLLDDFTRHNPLNQLKRSGGCAYCHQVTVPADTTLWKIVPPRIPDRWFGYSRFQHDRHRSIGCTECHFANQGKKKVSESTSTGDVLIPGIKICQDCHFNRPTSIARAEHSRLTGARTDCVECHSYHKRDLERPASVLTIPDYFGKASPDHR